MNRILKASFSTVSADVTKNLRVKAIAFDFPVILASDSLSNNQQNPPEQNEEVKLKESNNPFSNIKAKYADKIRMKIAKQAMEQQTTNLQAKVMFGTDSRWLVAEGMGDVLDYTYNRTVKLLLLGGYDQPAAIVEQLKSQLNTTKFAYIRKDTKIDEKHPYHSSKFVMKQSLLHLEHSQQLLKGNILLVSGNDDLLALAKERGYYTCRYRPAAKLFGQGSTDFVANNPLEVKDAIDDLIGVALRSSVSQQKF